jgi:hypothetical protein
VQAFAFARSVSFAASLLPTLLLGSTACAKDVSPARDRVLFDDFTYASVDALPANGWVPRTAQGWPGVVGATWEGSLAFVDDDSHAGNRLLRMTASTNGSQTRQAQLCHQRKYLEGTYAARVRFTDRPVSGPDGDQIVETFYLITPLAAPLDPAYSEQDFEYLPNGGWGGQDLTVHVTTWETFRPEPEWLALNATNSRRGSLEGWHTLVLQIAGHEVKYFLDGVPVATHGEPYYPESPMSINFNLWFIKEGLIGSTESRTYQEDVDWVFHEAQRVLSPAEVEKKVAKLRTDGVGFVDRVPPTDPALPSKCDL